MSAPSAIPVTTPFDTLAGLIALVSDGKGAVNTIAELKKAADEHRNSERDAIAAKVAADTSLNEARLTADKNAKDRAELDAQRAQFEADKAEHLSSFETAQTNQAKAAALLDARAANSGAEIAKMKRDAEDAAKAAASLKAKAQTDADVAAKAREEAEAALKKLKPLMAAMGLTS